MPTLDGVRPGDKVNMTIKMYFGLTEIKIECVIRDKLFVFTSAFDASDAYGGAQQPSMDYPSQQMLPPPTAGLAPPNPYPVGDHSSSQVSLHSGVPPSSYTYGSTSMISSTPTMSASQAAYAGVPPGPAYGGNSSVYGGHTAGGYPASQNDYYQQYSQYPPSQSYYSGYPPSSQGYPPQSGSSYYGQH